MKDSISKIFGLMLLVMLASQSGCGGGRSSDNNGSATGGSNPDSSDIPVVSPTPGANWFKPTVDTAWQWQLQGMVNTGYNVQLYDVDLFDSPTSLISSLQAAGKRTICYFSAGTYESFRSDAAEFLPAEKGNTLSGFADEQWLDIRSTNVHRIMRDRLDLAVQKGCDGVEPDNVDGYTNNPGFNFSANDQLAYNQLLATEAHNRGLAIGLKNDLDQVLMLVDDFDFSVNEQCHEFNECDLLAPFINAGKPVFNAEYASTFVNDTALRQQLCMTALAQQLHTLVLPDALDDSFRFSCDP
jgi:hypothetical protein